MKRYDVAIVGGGVMGSATARALARRGERTVLLERFEFGHNRGSSHGTSRIFRYSYPETRYVEMAIEARKLWTDLEREAEEEILIVTGGLDCGDDVSDNAEAMRSSGIDCVEMTPEEVHERWPHMALPAGGEAVYQEGGAVVAADRAWRAFVRSASRHSADILENSRVTAIEPRDGSVVIATSVGAHYEAGVAVVTSGAWGSGFAGSLDLDLDLRPTRQTVAHYELDGPPTPTYVEWGERSVYALASPGIGLKVGEHDPGETIDPDVEGRPNEGAIAALDEWVRSRYPGAGLRMKAEACLYTNAPGEEFVLERHGRVVVGSACSGHGFKFAPLIGERLADLALEA
jgi:sarcosine oxidase